ncbi:hypothetical protein CQY20_22000 [Mycolicibacterium agri]|uniref:Helix-turn-helix domain-containing protein n=1 Tax=Mycolicibacterium agri TaxID=36811 RepID=A0A2A7MUX2_MYCAG|nr:helix-turn-helix domain-containing protein [Mycolicibacterium agri]PEG35349.1 hypothetical protein CQY20_22000 [Mycolicibacterium agri]GFG53479.1 hypothetical protein MAGR_49200 [Mycolicibacterium agri]
MAPPQDSEQYTARHLAQMLGLGTTTITNWTKRHQAPLAFRKSGGRILIRWGDLITFLDAHPGLPAVARARDHIRNAGLTEEAVQPSKPQNLAAVARAAHAAARSASQAALTAARKEKDSAAKHLQIVEDLVAAMTSLDRALTTALGGTAE